MGDTVYFGSENGTVYALRANDGHTLWTYGASGAVKGGPAYANGKLYFGDYGGKVHAVRASDRSRGLVGRHDGSGAFGFGAGSFYSTPSVAFGRVYLGNTDGRVYSFAAGNGQLAWATGTGAYVYASPAVADTPGLGPTVYVGSYDGNFYAFDARSGAVRWRHPAGGRSPARRRSSTTSSSSRPRRAHTIAAERRARAREVWIVARRRFNPVIADRRTIYLDGYVNLSPTTLRPGSGRTPYWKRAQAAAARAAQQHAARSARRRGGSARPGCDRPHRHAGRREVRLDLGDRVVAVVEDRRAQDGVGAGLQRVDEVRRASPAPPEAITGTSTASRPRCVSVEVVAVARAVAVHAREQDLPRPALDALARPLDDVAPGRRATAGDDRPPSRRRLEASRRLASIASTTHWAPNCSAQLVDQLRPRDRRRVDADLVGARVEHRLRVVDGADPAADRERDEDVVGRAARELDDRVALLVRRRDVEEDELVGALGVVALRPARPGRPRRAGRRSSCP